MNYVFPRLELTGGKQKFIHSAFKDWNLLDPDIKSISSYSSFKSRLNNRLPRLIRLDT